ncbi:hypothetical protein SCHPADRAFT_1001366 [Schizopora paradoxa]|uniref:SAP domain-containing protein n=1 Tax=Schizopora paradoxa TaxID=27342 RepID=A0A0H2R8V8_9AGAM|nr:hypothetical protein SCHPADRAFT_1001366 [Schizopora paradoxa]
MSTTEILFNSPALHSLKRAQLVQLCKRHNIKAAGKNTELVERLKQHATTLKLNQLNGVGGKVNDGAVGDGDQSVLDELDSAVFDRPERPSEMWEIVMDDIPEEGGSSNPGSLKVKGVGAEFGGTGGSSKSTVSSSIKALASSLGLKRSMAVSESGTITSTSSRKILASSSTNVPGQPRESLLANAIPYASLPSSSSQPLNTEPFAFSYSAHDTSLQLGQDGGEDVSMSSIDRPIPGVGSRSGVEVAGLGATAGAGTIRLITSNLPSAKASSSAVFESPPRLTAVEPTFDLVPPTPGGLSANRWPMTPGRPLSSAPWTGFGKTDEGTEERNGIYPSLRNEDTFNKDAEDEDMDMPGGLGTPQQQSHSTPSRTALSPPRPDVFVFGTPHAKSQADFSKKAASSVLAEMNARLGLVGAKAVGDDILAGRSGNSSKMTEAEILNYQFGGPSGSSAKHHKAESSTIASKFNEAHEKEFAKMEGIDAHYSLRRGAQSKDATQDDDVVGPLPANRKRKSTVLETNQVKLGHGRPSSAVLKGRRSSNARVISAGTRKKLGMALPGAFGDDDDEQDNEDDTEERQAKRARPSEVKGKRVSIAPSKEETEKQRREREAVRRRLDAQKARRRSSRGRTSTGGPRASLVNQKRLQKPAPSRFGFLSSAAKSLVKSVWNRGAGAPTPAPSALPLPAKAVATQPASTSSREKPPIPNAKKPSFAGLQKPSTSSTASRVSVMGASRTASGSSIGFLGPQAKAAKSGTIASVASARSNMSTSTVREAGGPRSRSPMPSFDASEGDRMASVSSKVSHIATGSGGNRTSMASNPAPKRVRPSSTLLAPTASSLAKTNARRPLPVPPVQTSVHLVSSSRHEMSPNSASPSKIPVILPLSPRKKSLYAGPTSPTSSGKSEKKKTSIFSTPLVAPTTPGVNPISGLPSPSRIPLAANTTHQTTTVVQRGPSIQRKPRISRSKVIAKLGAQRAASATYSSTTTEGATQGDSNSGATHTSTTTNAENSQGLGPVVRNNKPRTRSSIGTSGRRIRSSVGGVKASAGIGARGSGVGLSGAGAGGVLMSAKRRARASEYARRRSEKARVMPGLQLSADNDDEGEGSMEVDA